MALVTTVQSVWYMLSGPASGAGNLDVLNCILTGLCARGNPKDEAALVLRRHVEEQARDLSGEAFFRFMDRLYDCITSLLESNDVTENLGALRAIDELIDIAIEENAIKFSKIATYMRTAFEAKREPETLALASKVLGHLARAGGAMMTDEVERLVKIALDWLRGDRIEYRRFAAVLILKEMAENASTVFNMHVSEFVDAIWVALRDPKLDIRVRAVEALRACLRVIEKRETRWRVQWYYCMFEAAQDGLGRNAPIHCIHGSLLAIGELLRNTGEFMMSRYREVAEIVLKYVEHRDRLVRLSITSLLPRIAHFLRDRFVANYLAICMKHILHVLKIPAEAASGFIALGEMAGALDGDLSSYFPTITSHLHDAIAPRRGRPSMEALACVGNLAKAVGPSMEPHVQSLLDTMLSIGLSSTLVEALENITASIPTLLPTIQVRLLDCISRVLSRHQQVQSNSSNALTLISSKTATLQVSELSGSALVQLALQTLAHFNFKDRDLLEFVRESVVPYLEDDDGGTRRGAALCSCKLMAKSLFGGIFSVQFTSNRTTRSVRRRRCLVAEILDKLLIAAVSDTDLMVRQSIFSSLHETGGFDDYLAQADCLTAVFAALNDEDFTVREIAISLAGRLSEKNPAYVLPTLRRHLIQLLTYLKQSADSKCREESVKLLGCLIRNCERLVLTYISPIHKALITELNEGTGASVNNGIISGVLVTVGDLARVGGFAMRQYIPELMPLIVEALFDSGAATKRVAITTLGQVVQSTGYVITPYNQYPQLLGLLLKLLNGELAWSIRREVLKVLGILGALDPHKHKSNQLSLPGSHGKVAGLACDHVQCTRSMDEVPMDLWPSFRTSEDFYSAVAISLLMQIFRDPSLSIYHQKVVGSLIFIFKAMNLGCVAFLPKVLPELFHTVRTCDDNNLKEYITWKLGTLVSIVHQHIRKYLPELFSLISELWSSFNLPATDRPVRGYPVLHLLEQLCLAFNDEFKRHLPFILPFCIQVLSDAERFKDYTYVVDILHTLEVFGGTLDEHMHLLLPALSRIFMLDASVEVRRAAITTLTKLIPHVQVKCHISALVHNMKIVLDGDNDDLRKDAVDALCCLAQAFGNDFTIFLPSIHRLLLKHHMPHNFEEIEDLIRRRRPLILGSAVQKQTRIPGEVISDPLNDTEDPECKSDPDKPHKVNEGCICVAAEASQRSTREDWVEWMRHFSIELLKESSAPALRTCARLSQLQPFVGRELFTAGFVSCWTELNEPCRRRLVRSLEMAFSSPSIPHEILATLLNLAEFMEHDGRPLPIDIRLLGALAEKCRAFAKALHYKEMEFEGAWSNRMDGNPVAVVETLIHINNQLHQHEAAVGILTYAQQHLGVQLKESWYEKLQQWDDALKAYTAKGSELSSHFIMEATIGRMRCLAALARWEELNNLCKEYWTQAKRDAKLEMAPMAASAAWNMGEWDQMAEYVSRLDDGDENKLGVLGNTATGDGSSNGTFFRAILLVHRGRYDEAREYIERARKCSATEVAALVLESYERAYTNMVRVQQLSELEEVIDYCTLPAGNPVAEGRRALIRNMWSERLRGAKRNIEVWQALLSVRSLVLPPTEDAATWIKFASLCRKSGRISQARSTLIKLLQFNPESTPETVQYHGDPQVILAYLKYQWSLGDDHKCKEALARLKDLAMDLSRMPGFQQSTQSGILDSSSVPFVAHVYLKLGTWQWALSPGLNEDSIQGILNAFHNATHCAANWAKAWHKWALFNTAVMSHYTRRGCPSIAGQFVVAGVTGYFNSIAYGAHVKGVDDSLQDILRLLTLWFNHGASSEVQLALERGFSLVNINTWLVVLPQIIARIHSSNRAVRELTQTLLVRIGQSHPQALMYPLLVACNSSCNLRKHSAQEVVDKVRQHSGVLVAEAQLVSTELIRVSVLWQEMWHGALEEASRLYFGEHNAIGMLNSLEPLHRILEEGAMRNNNTENEQAFLQQFHQELMEAYICSIEYRRTGESKQLNQAWDCYYSVFKLLNKQLPTLNTLELQSVSPELLHCRHLKLAVPGTYKPDSHVVTIASFSPQLVVITSKQRPRKLTIHGSDGEEYAFLLKGNEDLRQDERVMQLFGLVNTLLANSRKTAEKDLSIQRYAVIPLSRNSGLIEWVPNCDTLHSLIQEYRDARKIDLNQEYRLMLGFTTNYDHLPVISKVEAFEYALKNTKGNDLSRVLWLKSRTSEIWLERRTNYTTSLAVMSMVGYLLGLGDRHPSNLMLHRYSGKILHIDFGDCFEASMNRDKFPEKVPFRLTRMLIKAMEVGGIEGNFRSICESVMEVLRTNKASVMAMMEAFVHDPLINWRLVNFNGVPSRPSAPSVNGMDPSPSTEMLQPQRAVREKELLQAVNQLDDAKEVLNERAVAVMARMSEKLTGRDFSSSPSASIQSYLDQLNGLIPGDTQDAENGLSVKDQVQKLILQATSQENLCQNYFGWCPFW